MKKNGRKCAALLLAVCLIPYPLSHGESILAHILG